MRVKGELFETVKICLKLRKIVEDCVKKSKERNQYIFSVAHEVLLERLGIEEKEKEECEEIEEEKRSKEEECLLYILGVISDQMIKTECAYEVINTLYEKIRSEFKEFKPSIIVELNSEGRFSDIIRECFNETRINGRSCAAVKNAEKWIRQVPKYIVQTCKKLKEKYNDNACLFFEEIANIAKENLELTPSLIYLAFRMLPGIGPKKASMVVRDVTIDEDHELFKFTELNLSDVKKKYFTKIPIDIHVRRVLGKLGISRRLRIQYDYDYQAIAEIIYPENPGMADAILWSLGRIINEFKLSDKYVQRLLRQC